MDLRDQVDSILRIGHTWNDLRNEFINNCFFAVACFVIIMKRDEVSPVILSTVFFDSMRMHWMHSIVWGYNWLIDNLDRIKWSVAMQQICPQEKKEAELVVDPKVWPMKGAVEFKDVRLKYRAHLPEVLKGLSFKVEGGEKVGLVGRTGAGKSTISLAIPRIVEALSGSIEIDGIDIGKVDLHTLRNKLTVVPQEPVLFNGSLRFNLDPFNQNTDEEILAVLEKAGLQEFIDRESKAAALEAKKKRKELRKKIRKAETKMINVEKLNLFGSIRNDRIRLQELDKHNPKEGSK